jgi:hypothetical protein
MCIAEVFIVACFNEFGLSSLKIAIALKHVGPK